MAWIGLIMIDIYPKETKEHLFSTCPKDEEVGEKKREKKKKKEEIPIP